LIGLPCSLDTLTTRHWLDELWAAPLPSCALTGTGRRPEPVALNRPAGGHRRVSRPRRPCRSPRWGRGGVAVPSSSLNKCLVQTTVSDAAVEMKSAASRGPDRRVLLTREESCGGITFSVDNRRPDKGSTTSIPSTISIPKSTSSSLAFANFPIRSVRKDLSSVMSCETLATESFGRPVAFATRSTLPGASAQRRLLVSGTQTTVAIRLRLNASP